MSIAESLAAAMDSLTPENWQKGGYFSAKGETMCMCVHGAVQVQVNPLVAKALLPSADLPYGRERRTVEAEVVEAATRSTAAAAASEAAELRAATAAAADALWSIAPSWCTEESPYGTGSLAAHYVLGMVGLTAAFNDAKDTTLDMVKEKMREAIALAERIGV